VIVVLNSGNFLSLPGLWEKNKSTDCRQIAAFNLHAA
jgi:hypothetical protein